MQIPTLPLLPQVYRTPLATAQKLQEPVEAWTLKGGEPSDALHTPEQANHEARQFNCLLRRSMFPER